MTDFGWITIHRTIQKHWIMEDSRYFHAWILILFNVNFEDKKTMIKGKLYNCERGQSIYSMNSWAKIFGKSWNRRKVGIFLKLLEKDEMVKLNSDNKTSHLTVCNYGTYQDQTYSKRTPDVHQTSSKRTQLNKDNKDNKVNNKGKGVFTPPTILELQEYIFIQEFSVDSENFHDFYSSKGWKVGNAKMKDWKAAVRTWNRRNKPDITTGKENPIAY